MAQDGLRQLCAAIRNDQLDIIHRLVNSTVDVNAIDDQSGRLPLELACERGNVRIVDLLLKSGASCAGVRGTQSLSVSSQHGHVDIVDLLVDHKAPVNAFDNEGNTPLYCAVTGRHVGAVLKLIERDAEVNLMTANGRLPLHAAVENVDQTLVETLVLCGADPNAIENTGSCPLHVAVKTKCVEMVTFLLQSGAEVDARDKENMTSLALCAKYGTPEIVAVLIERGANVNALDTKRGTPLHCAVSEQRVDMVRKLLECGADVNLSREYGVTPLMTAATKNEEIALQLLQAGAEIERSMCFTETHNTTALCGAILSGQTDIACLLIKKGAIVNAHEPGRRGPLHIAVENCDLQVVNELLNAGADVNAVSAYTCNETPLSTAVKSGSVEIVQCLIARGADLNSSMAGGFTPLMESVMMNNHEITSLLIASGADINKTEEHGFTAVILAINNGFKQLVHTIVKGVKWATVQSQYKNPRLLEYACDNESIEIISILLDGGFDVNAADYNGFTVLMKAAERGQTNVLKALIHQGASVNASNKFGSTALHLAAQRGNTEVVHILLKTGANLHSLDKRGLTPLLATDCAETLCELLVHRDSISSQKDKQFSPLFAAAKNGDREELERLLSNSAADINAVTGDGSTPLMWASRQGHVTVVVKLLECGAEVDAIDDRDRTALWYAAANGHQEVVRELINRCAVTSVDWEFVTPLNIASKRGHESVRREIHRRYDSKLSCTLSGDIDSLFFAAKTGNADIVATLTGNGLDVNLHNHNHDGTALHTACEQGQLQIAVKLIEYGADLNLFNSRGQTPIWCASANGFKEIVKELTARGASVNACSQEKSTPLSIAAKNGYCEIVELLLPKATRTNCALALQHACARGHRDVVDVLLRSKVNMDLSASGSRTLLLAAENGNATVVELLLKHKVDVNATSDNGITPLLVASQKGHDAAARVLLQHGADCNMLDKRGTMPLAAAASLGHVSTVRLLLEFGAETEKSDGAGRTPLWLAAANGREEVVYLLIEHGADVNACDNTGTTPVHVAELNQHQKVVILLVQHGCSVNASNSATINAYKHALKTAALQQISVDPLHFFCINRQPKVVDQCIASGRDVDARDAFNMTPLSVAVDIECVEIVESLIKAGGDVNALVGTDGLTPVLNIAAAKGNREIVNILLRNGAECNVRKSGGRIGDGITPLHAACIGGHVDIVRSLISTGAYIDARCSAGNTPLAYSVFHGFTEIVSLLLSNGASINVQSILHPAIHLGHLDVIYKLLDAGADIESMNEHGLTPLWEAVAANKTDIAIALIERGANTNAKLCKNGSLFTLLFYAIESDDRLVHSLLRHGADVNAKSSSSLNTPLMAACFRGNFNIVVALLERGACVNDRNLDGHSPITCAFGNCEVLEMILSHGAQVNRYLDDPNSKSPLHYAINEASIDAIRVLIQHDVDVNELSSGMQPLYIACLNQMLDVVELLLDHGAEINALSAGNSTALDAAIFQQNVALMQLLLTRGGDITYNFHAKIHVAVGLGNEEVFGLLLRSKSVDPALGREAFAHTVVRGGRSHLLQLLLDHCQIEFKASDVHDFVSTAIRNNDQPTLDLLLNLCSESTVFIADRDNKCSNIIYTAARNGQSTIVRLLVERGVSVNVRNVDGKSPLIIAASAGHLDTVKLLIESGSDVFAVDDEGKSALQHASFNGHRDIVSLLLHYQRHVKPVLVYDGKFEGNSPLHNLTSSQDVKKLMLDGTVDVDTENLSGSKPLHFAVRRGFTEVAQLLISFGAGTDAANFFGDTPLHEAARHGIEMTKLMLAHARELNVQNIRGSSPLHEAVQSGLFDVVLHLLHNGADPGITDNWMNTPFQYVSHEDLLSLMSAWKALPKSNLSCLRKPNLFGISVLKRYKNLLQCPNNDSKRKTLLCDRTNEESFSDGDMLGNTELHRAVGVYGASKLHPVLLAADKAVDFLSNIPGSHINVRNIFGQTPLHVARSILAVEACLKYGGKAALMAVDNRGRNFWHLLASHDDADRIVPLIEKTIPDLVDVGLDAIDAMGRTPLHYAVTRTNGEAYTAWLIDKAKLCLDIPDWYGRTPLHNWYSRSEDRSEGSRKTEAFLIELNTQISCDVKNTPSRLKDVIKKVNAIAWQEKYFGDSRKVVLDQFDSVLSHLQSGQQQDIVLRQSESETKFIWGIWTSYVHNYVESVDSQSNKLEPPQKATVKHNVLDTSAAATVFQAISEIVTNAMHNLVRRLAAIDDRFHGQLLPAGSAHEQTKIDLCDEFDFVVLLTHFSRQCTVVESPYSPHGYVHLKQKSQNDSRFDEFFDENGLLNTRLVKFRFEMLVKQALSEACFQQENDYVELIDNVHGENFFNSFYPDRLATNIQLKFMKPVCGRNLFHDVSIDIVPAINIDNYWPSTAIPDTDVLRHLVRTVPDRRCYLVFEQPQKKHPWTRWTSSHARVDFSVFESNVVRSCPPVVRASCVIVKQIVRNFCDFHFFKSYVVKAALMHCIFDALSKGYRFTEDDVTYATIDQLVSLVQQIVRRLLCFVLQDFVPSVFMPTFSLPVCSFETHLKFSQVKLHLSGLTYDKLISSNSFTGDDKNRLVDAQFDHIIKAFVVSHLMLWSVLPNTAARRLYLPPINPLREVDYWSSMLIDE